MIATQLDTYLPPPSRWTRWQREEPVLVGYDLCGVRGELLDRAVPADRKDALLAALIRCGQHPPDADAKIAVIVCLLPGLRRIAGRYRDIIGSKDVWAELLVAVWEHVDGYDLDRRPGRVAANLLYDTTHRLVNFVRRERAWRDHTDIDDGLDDLASPEVVGDADALAVAVVAGVLAPVDATLIEATRLSGLGLAEAARLLGLTYEAAKKRRRRAEVAWLGWWAPELRPSCELPEQVAA